MARIYKILARSHTGAVEFVVMVVHLAALGATRNAQQCNICEIGKSEGVRLMGGGLMEEEWAVKSLFIFIYILLYIYNNIYINN